MSFHPLKSLRKRFFDLKKFWFGKILSENRPVSCGKIEQPALFLGEGRIEIDKTATLGYFPSPYFYSGYQHIEARSKDAAVFVGAGTFLNNNAVVIAERAKITIGKNCLIGTNFRCLSSDFHGVDPDAREVYKSADIQVGDNVFVGNDVVILKGVTIGAGTTIAAGAVVTRSFPPKSVIAGNPAKLIKTIGE